METMPTTPNNEQEIRPIEKEFFNTLLQFTKNKEEVRKIFEKLTNLYSQEGRHYHNLKHIQAMVSFLETNRQYIKNWNSVVLATWYHDAIYATHSKTNEEDSADLATQDLQRLGLPEDLLNTIKN